MGFQQYPASAGGSGDVVGPASSTDNAVARFDSTTGKLLQNSTVICDDSGNLTGVGTVNGVKVYRALLTQTGTDAPVATVLENTLGGTVVWTWTGGGVYLGTLAGAFLANTTLVFINGPDTGAFELWQAGRATDNTVSLENNVGDGWAGLSIEIIVYP